MRLNTIDCVRGELVRENHILLQFTGLYDKQEEEIYEMDVVLIGSKKFIVVWDIGLNGWSLAEFSTSDITTPFQREQSKATIRLCNYYETEMKN